MIIDSKGKLFGKVSIIDILIILVIVAGIAGVGYKFTKAGQVTPFTKEDTMVIQFYHYEIEDFKPKAIKVGDAVKDAKTGAYIGKVTKVEIGASKSTAFDDKGQYQPSGRPGYASFIITIEGTGIYRDGVTGQGVSFGGTDYFVGKSAELFAGNTDVWTYVYSISKKE